MAHNPLCVVCITTKLFSYTTWLRTQGDDDSSTNRRGEETIVTALLVAKWKTRGFVMNEKNKYANVLLAVAQTGFQHLGGAHGVDQWRKGARVGHSNCKSLRR
jgi:hypothetical protein